MKKLVSLLLALLMLGSMVACTGDDTPDTTEDTTGDVLEGGEETAEDTVEETEAETAIDDLFGGIEDGHFTKAVTAKTIYYMNPTTLWSHSTAGMLALGSLQGLVARCCDEQIYLMGSDENTEYVRTVTERDWNVTWSDTVDGKEISLENLLAYYADKNVYKGYILCSDENEESQYVAVSIAGLIDAVVVMEENKALLENLGFKCLLDVSDKDDAWLRQSEYWDQLNKDIAIERLFHPREGVISYGGLPGLIDLAVLNGAYATVYNGYVKEEHAAHFEYLNDDAYIFGWYIPIGEDGVVDSLGRINAGIIPADTVKNLSVLTGFSLDSIQQKRLNDAAMDAENVHTVTFVYTDGDNLWWFTEGPFITTDRYMYYDPNRTFSVGWGLPATSLDLMGPVATYLYETKPIQDEFVMSLSGTTYTYVSRWDEAARAEMSENLAAFMERMDLKYMVLLDDSAGTRDDIFADFTEHDQIEGIFYVGYDWKSGRVIWTDGKPTVHYRNYFDYSAAGGYESYLNWLQRDTLSTDPTKTRSYSFYYINAWGTHMDSLTSFVNELPDNVEVVTPSEFMDRLVANCKPTEE